MKAMITGSSGTVGKALKAYFKRRKIEVVSWDRATVAIDDYYAMERFVKLENPGVVYHLATASQPTGLPNESWRVNYDWTSELAWITRMQRIRFVFASSVMVFSNDAKGPFMIDAKPDAPQGYGYEKRMAEKRVFYQNPDAYVARLGWQIGSRTGGNHMVDYLQRQQDQHGHVLASSKWLPACAFLNDTAGALVALLDLEPALYQLDSNDHWTFFDIATS